MAWAEIEGKGVFFNKNSLSLKEIYDKCVAMSGEFEEYCKENNLKDCEASLMQYLNDKSCEPYKMLARTYKGNTDYKVSTVEMLIFHLKCMLQSGSLLLSYCQTNQHIYIYVDEKHKKDGKYPDFPIYDYIEMLGFKGIVQFNGVIRFKEDVETMRTYYMSVK